jgi:hypothetical protein
MLKKLLIITAMFTVAQGRSVVFRNTDNSPMTLRWKTMSYKGGVLQPLPWEQVLGPRSEADVQIDDGPGKPVQSFKVSVTQKYLHLNQPGVNEFDLVPEFNSDKNRNAAHIELGAEDLLKVLQGARVLTVKYPSEPLQVKSLDLKKVSEAAGEGFNLNLPAEQIGGGAGAQPAAQPR